MREKLYLVKVSYATKNENRTMKQGELVNLLIDSSESYTQSLGVIRAAMGDPSKFIPHYAFAAQKLEKFGCIDILDGPNHPDIARLSEEELIKLIRANESAVDQIGDDKHPEDLQVTYFESRSHGGTMLHKASVSEAMMCENCSESITTETKVDHQASIACMEKTESLKMENDGYVLVDAEEENDVVKTKNIHFVYRPSGGRGRH